MRSGSHPPDVRLHAMADIQQQDDVNLHLLALEIPDLLLLSIHSQDEILVFETANGTACHVHYVRIDTSQRDVAAKSDRRIAGLWGSDRRRVGRQKA